MMKLRRIVKIILGQRLCDVLRVLLRGMPPVSSGCLFFDYDKKRFYAYSGMSNPTEKEALRARVVMNYHVLEKGLTMPNRRLGFGREVVTRLVSLIEEFEGRYGESDQQVKHASGVVKAYWEMHYGSQARATIPDVQFWNHVDTFALRHKGVPTAPQRHMTKDEFYAKRELPFPKFAWARHTLRHYSNRPLSNERVKKAVDLARSTPSACNRQHCRVYCLSDKETMGKLLSIQGGNRGFGHLADKLLIVTSDLEDSVGANERYDIYINGGMFLMNLCYALFYYEIAHCILNWSRTPDEDRQMREIIKLKDSESVIALLSCGETPDEFDVATSPRKTLSEMYAEDGAI